MYRVLVTGSRNWDDESAIHQALRAFAENCGQVIVVHGGAKGADQMAHKAALRLGMTRDVYPADWAKHGKRAGFVRNKAMVESGADVCLAFIRDDSKGATMCADLAEREGIQVNRFRNCKECGATCVDDDSRLCNPCFDAAFAEAG